MKIALIILLIIISMIIGAVVPLFIFKSRIVGTLRCAMDPEEPNSAPYMFAEFNKDFYYIYSKKYIVLKINDVMVTPKDTHK